MYDLIFLNITEDDVVVVVLYNSVFVVSIGVLIVVLLLVIAVVNSSTEIGGVISLFDSEFSCKLRTIVVRFSSETALAVVFSCKMHVR